MKFRKPIFFNTFQITFAGLMFAILLTTSDLAAEEQLGKQEFILQCAVCHGPGGKGNGPIADILKVQPPDLTQISKNNDGEYPVFEMIEIIDGRREVRAHGTRVMPIWGERYATTKDGEYGMYDIEDIILGRILKLIYYLRSIQEK